MKLRDLREQLAAFRNSTDAELDRQLNDAYRNLFNLRMRHATRALENDREIGRSRKMIARIKTVLRERELARELEAAEA